ncbi:NitT/TauT family transport system permease protein [Mumia flava]|uniref:NitT/TauT family transport system permease protein n=1 Tax=Mumia flava TaxID=1348852 RepID=A0A0B2BJU5_9ACTN|nr:ABC transporter permease [Mumia flava]PJJ57194.1 NitT/TauT family transport system permease protein [Mumia flava]
MAQTATAPAAPTSPPAARTRKPLMERIPTPVLLTIALAVLVAVWQGVIAAGLVNEYVLPTPWDTAVALWDVTVDLFTGGPVFDAFLVSAQETLYGLLIAAVAGVVLGVAIAETVIGRRVLQPLMVALYAAPKVALAPLFVAWFGFGMAPKIVMAAVIAFFPVMVDTAAGLAGIDEDEDKLFRSMRASRWQRFFKLKLMNALPFIFAGLKSAAVLAVIGAIVAEFLGGGEGLGVMVKTASVGFALDRVFAFVILLSVLAFLVYLAVDVIERRVIFWRQTGFLPTES